MFWMQLAETNLHAQKHSHNHSSAQQFSSINNGASEGAKEKENQSWR